MLLQINPKQKQLTSVGYRLSLAKFWQHSSCAKEMPLCKLGCLHVPFHITNLKLRHLSKKTKSNEFNLIFLSRRKTSTDSIEHRYIYCFEIFLFRKNHSHVGKFKVSRYASAVLEAISSRSFKSTDCSSHCWFVKAQYQSWWKRAGVNSFRVLPCQKIQVTLSDLLLFLAVAIAMFQESDMTI